MEMAENEPLEWIRVEEQMPDPHKYVLFYEGDDIRFGVHDSDGDWISDELVYCKGQVTAWMPLPKPPVMVECQTCKRDDPCKGDSCDDCGGTGLVMV